MAYDFNNARDKLFVQPLSGLSVPWREYISREGSTYEESWANDSGQVSMTIDIYWTDRMQARQEILGYSKRIGNKLSRQLPMRHPFWPWLYATRIASARGLAFQNKYIGPAGPVSQYAYERLTVVFSALPFDVLSDNQAAARGGEFSRFVIKSQRLNVDFAASDRGQFVFTAGPNTAYSGGGTPLPGPPASTFVPAPQGIRQCRTTLQWKWMNVVHNFIFDSNNRLAKIAPCIGTVNSDTALDSPTASGYPAGTLLLDSIELEPVLAPCGPDVLGLAEGTSPRMWNVLFNLVFFNPPNDPGYGYTERGWLLVPGRNTPDAYWYPIASWPPTAPAVVGAPLYQSRTFATMFTAV